MKKHLLLLSAMFLALLSCRQNAEIDPNPAFADYVYAYSGGLVNENASIRIKFTGAADTSVPPEDLFRFSPSVKGSARWAASDMVEFLPDAGALKPGRRYNVSFALSKVFEVGNPELREFKFSFTVARKKAEIFIDQVYISKNNVSEAAVRGHVALSESVPAELMKNLFYAEGNTAGSRFSVEQKSGVWHFVCEGLPRKGTDERLNVVFDAHRAGFGESISASVIIPGTDVFKVLSAKSCEGAEPYVELVMSSPLDPLADLDGFFSFSDGRSCSALADGNVVKISYMPGDEEFTLTVDPGLKDAQGRRLGTAWSADFRQDELKPAVKLLFQGTVLPDDSNLKLAFKSVNLNAVDLKVVQIFRHNVLSFLQDNNLDEDYQLRRSGRLVYSRKISLETGADIDLHQWQNFCIDLSGLMKREKGAIYSLSLSFRKEYSVYGSESAFSGGGNAMTTLSATDVSPEENALWDIQQPYYYDNNFNWNEYEWQERDNPYHVSYYMESDRFPSVNLMTSNLGVLAKYGESGDMCVFVNDIISAEPLKGVEVEVYGYQKQKLCGGVTGSDGKVSFHSPGKPFVVVAQTADAVSYLKLGEGASNSLSRFDVGGIKAEKGMRGYIYGDRGVWRPGDDIHLTLAVKSDTGEKLPDNHPAVMELYDARGHLHSRTVCTKAVGGLYTFNVSTSADAPTGTWNAYIKLGGAAFHKSVPVETIKANRLKIKVELDDNELKATQPMKVSLSSSWLAGGAAAGLKAKSELLVSRTVSPFKGYEKYNFCNPLSDFRNYEKDWFSAVLDSEGKAGLTVTVPNAVNAPGLLKATLVTRVAEPGGDESVVSATYPYSPFSAYVGVRAPEDNYLETDRDYDFGICVLDSKGKRVSGHRIQYTIYKVDWKWWWQSSPDELASYISGETAKVYGSGEFLSGNSDYKVPFSLAYPDWGRFLLYVRDMDGGHASGAEFTCDWPLWRGRADREGGESAAMLSFSIDKTVYHPGDEGHVYIPAAKDGRAIVTFENGSGVISSDIIRTSADRETAYRFKVTEAMSPNCYVAVTLLNPYSISSEGMPLRMYGVKPFAVVDESSRLHPRISLPDELAPQKDFTVKVSEGSGRPMAYTIAIVDEGLLDISNFKTPDPWAAMNRKVALGVQTWDLYNDVAGVYSGSFSSMFKIGGDEDLSGSGRSAKDNRFEPVALFAGPFQLSSGEAEHTFRLPMYSGSVRVMLVAASGNAFGNAEKTVPVRTPLMVIPSLPQRLGPGEKTVMPVNVFVNGNTADEVKLTVKTEGPLALGTESEQVLKLPPFSGSSDQTRDALAHFTLSTAEQTGNAKVIVRAKCGSSEISDTLSLEVKSLMPSVTRSRAVEIAPGETASYSIPQGVESATVEACTFPAFDVNACRLSMMNTLSGYTGQMASAGIALIALRPFMTENQRSETDAQVKSLLNSICARQLPDGSFRAWDSGSTVDLWADAAAAHFLASAAFNGFSYPGASFKSWRNKAVRYISAFVPTGERDDEVASYILYVLALSGNAQEGVMNRIKDVETLSGTAVCLLSSAYALAGRSAVASAMLEGGAVAPKYDSDRDASIALRACVLAGNRTRALPLASELAASFASYSYSAQVCSFAAEAWASLMNEELGYKLSLDYESVYASEGSTTEKVKPAGSRWSAAVPAGASEVKIRNTSVGTVYSAMSYLMTPSSGTQVEEEFSGLYMDMVCVDSEGKTVFNHKDASAVVKQGEDYTIYINVAAPVTSEADNLELRLTLPSGWEVFNTRMFADETLGNADVRSDEIVWYESLAAGENRKFSARVRAVYQGEYSLPPITCVSASDSRIHARLRNARIRVLAE